MQYQLALQYDLGNGNEGNLLLHGEKRGLRTGKLGKEEWKNGKRECSVGLDAHPWFVGTKPIKVCTVHVPSGHVLWNGGNG